MEPDMLPGFVIERLVANETPARYSLARRILARLRREALPATTIEVVAIPVFDGADV